MRHPGRLRRHSRGARFLVASAALAAAAAAAAVGLPTFTHGWVRWGRLRAATPSAAAPKDPPPGATLAGAELSGALARAQGEIERLSARVSKRGVVPRFGRRAAAIVRRAVDTPGCSETNARKLQRILDASLEALFLRQLRTLVVDAVDLYEAEMERRPNPLEASLAAQALFDRAATELRPPSSSWSCEAEREDLLARLGESYSRDALLLDEQAKQGRGKKVTIDVIRKLQEQAAGVQRDVETRGALPWNVKWQYMVEGSPLGFRGQYVQGRSVVEMLLTPSPDPRQKDKVLNRLGPLNLAVAFDMLR